MDVATRGECSCCLGRPIQQSPVLQKLGHTMRRIIVHNCYGTHSCC